MKSSNPHSGCRQVEVAKTLDTTDPNPSKNQGGIAVVEAVPYAFHLQQDPIGGSVSPCIGGQHQATVGVAFQPVPGVLLDDQGGQQINVRTDGKSPTLRAETHGNLPCVVEAAGFKAGQSAGEIGWQDECAATLAAECSGSEPSICIRAYDIGEERRRTPSEYTDLSPTLTARCGTGGNNVPAVVEAEPCYCLQGNGTDRADTAGCNGKGWKEGVCYTLNTIDRPAVAHLASGK
jgi:hypothetical protein